MHAWFTPFYEKIAQSPLSHWLETLPAQLSYWQKEAAHGELAAWQKVINNLPDCTPSHIDLASQVQIGTADDISDGQRKQLTHLLKRFMPWRKGPFSLFGIEIDTEWRSDWKWDRVLPHISPLAGRTVLDVGCGSGYHLWRMRGEGADLVVGIDPSELFLCQFQTIKRYHQDQHVHLLPLGVEQLPQLNAFDTVFSMGVLYHRRSPIDFLAQLKAQLRKDGELVLETLVIEGDVNTVFMPTDRYAKMRNVWYIPSTAALTLWLERVGFKEVQVVDIDQTSLQEQRRTPWMENESLADFLHPENPNQTIEGHHAPLRAVLIAKA